MKEYRNVNGHIEVFIDGDFAFSSDTLREAMSEVEYPRLDFEFESARVFRV